MIQCSSLGHLARINKCVYCNQSVRIYVEFLTILSCFFYFMICAADTTVVAMNEHVKPFFISLCLTVAAIQGISFQIHSCHLEAPKTSFGVKFPHQHSSHISKRSLFKVLLVMSHLSSSQHMFLLTESTCLSWPTRTQISKRANQFRGGGCKGLYISGSESENLWKRNVVNVFMVV